MKLPIKTEPGATTKQESLSNALLLVAFNCFVIEEMHLPQYPLATDPTEGYDFISSFPFQDKILIGEMLCISCLWPPLQ